MSKVIFVTVGTTALSAEHLGAAQEHTYKPLRDQARTLLRCRSDGRKSEIGERLFDKLVDAHSLHPPGMKYLMEPTRTSAEMTSTYLLLQPQEGLPGAVNQGQDRIVLLASDTEEGKLGARVNAALMRKFFFKCSCPADICHDVCVEVIDGLESHQPKAGPLRTKNSVAAIMQSYASYDRFFNITGGFKGAVPAITHLCSNEFSPCPMFYQYETAGSAVRIELLAQGYLEDYRNIVIGPT